MKYFCGVCDKAIKIKPKNKQLQSLTNIKLVKCK